MKTLFSFRSLLLLCITLIISSNANCQTDWKTKLLKNTVKVENGKYSIEEYMLIKIDDETSIQIKTSATAPTDVMSRDNFVSIYSSYGMVYLLAILSEAGTDISSLDIKELDELIGKPDIAIHFEMTKNGFQIQLTTDEETNRQTITWEDMFNK